MKPAIKDYEEGQKTKRPVNQQLINRIYADEQFEHMRKGTTLDDFSSAIGTMRLNEKVLEWLEQQKAKNEALQKALQEQLEKQKQLESQRQKQQKAEDTKF